MTWAAHLRKSLKRFRRWPHWEPYPVKPPLQHLPVGSDADVEFYSDIRWLQDMGEAVYEDCRLTAAEVEPDVFADLVARPLLAMVEIPVESPTLAASWDWPDHAAALIEQWRIDIEVRGMLEAIETENAA